MLADELDYVVGVDTHLDEHVLAVVAAPTGAVVARQAVRGERARLRGGAALRGRGSQRCARLGGRGRRPLRRGPRPLSSPAAARRCSRSAARPRAERRLRGKDDSLDAIRAARAALASETLALPRSGERREALRLLLIARRSAVDVRREALVQLRSVIVTAPDRLRERAARAACRQAARALSAAFAARARHGRTSSRRGSCLRSLARRIEAATHEAAELEREILAHVRALAPQLLDEPGVGPIVAAQLIVAWSHRGRVRSEAAFARLAGVAPVPASSGQTTRHRLSRGGDRQLNRALHTVVLHRRQHDPTTKDYIARRIAEGKSRRDATRLLKRYLARHLYRLLQNQEPLLA